jgi:hypothetical protein
VSALNSDSNRRAAERHALPKPVPATFGGFNATLIDFSLTGCRIEHTDRMNPRMTLPLRFFWRGTEVKMQATLVRSEMVPVRGKPGYVSGLIFADSADDAPPVVRDIVQWLRNNEARNTAASEPVIETPPPAIEVADEVDDDVEEIEAMSTQYLQCVFSNGRWDKLYVDKPKQPADGFTIVAPNDEREADVLCRAYEKAAPDVRKAMRARFEKALQV